MDKLQIWFYSFPAAEVMKPCKHSAPVNHSAACGRVCLKPGQSCDCVHFGQPLREDLTDDILGGVEPKDFNNQTPLDGLDHLVSPII